MPFRLWYYLAKVGAPLLFAGAVLGMILRVALPDNGVGMALSLAVFGCLGVLGIVGGVLGIFFTIGRLRMRCPFCGQSGTVGGSREEGLWLDCDGCGIVRGAGLFGLRLIREEAENADE
jgi:hypothetical protein